MTPQDLSNVVEASVVYVVQKQLDTGDWSDIVTAHPEDVGIANFKWHVHKYQQLAKELTEKKILFREEKFRLIKRVILGQLIL